MWARPTEPDFILPPRHARVFRTALHSLSDFIGGEDWAEAWPSGIAVFDRLTPGQQQAALLTVARALLDAQTAAVPITAVLAAAVSATYDTLLALIEMDITSPDHSTDLREQVLAALAEMDYWAQLNEGLLSGAPPSRPPEPAGEDLQQWADLVNVLRDQVLEDYDFELENELVDREPTAAGAVKDLLRIDRDYFVAVPEDPTPERLAAIRRELIAFLEGDQPETGTVPPCA